MKPFVVGLTGGIGSGKSTVADRFEQAGACVVDTDAIAHRLSVPGGAAMAAIAAQFGPGFVAPDGSMDRAAMRRLVFADADARASLEGILHPMIRAESARQLAHCTAPYALLVVPLLLERTPGRPDVDRVLVVDCAESTQIVRVQRRSGISADEVRAILAAQIPRAQRLARADDVVLNDGDIGALAEQIEALDRRYRDMAAQRS